MISTVTRSSRCPKKTPLTKDENDRFEHHRRYADLHLLVEGHEFLATVPVS